MTRPPAPKGRAPSPLEIRPDPVTGPEMIALLQAHLREMIRITPPGSVHALDLDGLRRPDVAVWGAWQGRRLLGCGALKRIDARLAEIKSMHTAAEHRGRGIAQKVLDCLLEAARQRGHARVSLETGSTAGFAAARRFYRRNGFVACGPFADYHPDPHSLFLTRALEPAGGPAHPSGRDG